MVGLNGKMFLAAAYCRCAVMRPALHTGAESDRLPSYTISGIYDFQGKERVLHPSHDTHVLWFAATDHHAYVLFHLLHLSRRPVGKVWC